LHRGGIPLSPSHLQVDAVLDIASDVFVSYQSEPTTSDLALIDESGEFTPLTDGTSWHSGIRKGALTLISRADLATTTSRVAVQSPAGDFTIESNAEVSIVSPKVQLCEVGPKHLRAAVLFPAGHAPGTALPVICSPYGGPHAARVISTAAAFTTEQWLADQGFAVVVIDGRGTPGRGPDWEFAIQGNLADPVLEDQVSGLQALAELYPDLDLTRVGIRGWSFGGYLAALAVLDRPDVFHAAVAGAPVTEWRLYDTGYTERYLGLPDEKPDDYDNSSLLTRAHKLTRPLLLIHGLADDNVVAAHTLQMSSTLLAAGRAHNVLPLSGVTHMTPQEIVAENLLLTEVEFFRNNLSRN
jgi:dipeptidyl-peptidase-4